MYTGVHPNKHGYQFIWRYNPDASPFGVLNKLKINKLPHNIFTKFVLYKTLAYLKYRTVPYGFLFFERYPIDYWALFDYKEVTHSGKPDYDIGGYPTIFKILEQNGFTYCVNWNPRGTLQNIPTELDFAVDWNYIYIGHLDPVSHKHGQPSHESGQLLKHIDNILERVYNEYNKRYNDFHFMVFSDHGHVPVENFVGLHRWFNSHGMNLKNYIHFIDSCYARFWFRDSNERKQVEQVFESTNKGYILDDDRLSSYASRFDPKQGDLVFYLDAPNVFSVVHPDTVSMHGYSPEYNDSHGVIASNTPIIKNEFIKLQDILPTIVNAYGIQEPEHVDGDNIWVM